MPELQDQNTIYIVDDDAAVRDSLGALLEAVGWTVQSYGSGRAFLEVCDTGMRGCLLLDIRMPELDGLQVQRILSQRGVTLPFIVISGHGDISSAVRAMKAGATEFLRSHSTARSCCVPFAPHSKEMPCYAANRPPLPRRSSASTV